MLGSFVVLILAITLFSYSIENDGVGFGFEIGNYFVDGIAAAMRKLLALDRDGFQRDLGLNKMRVTLLMNTLGSNS